MKFKIQSRARSSQVDHATERVRSKVILVKEVLEFDHFPTGEEIQTALANLPKYTTCTVRFVETLSVKKLSE